VAGELVITGRIFTGRECGQFDGRVGVRDGRIAEVSEASSPPPAKGALVIDAGRRAVMPGPVDSAGIELVAGVHGEPGGAPA
jgi:cytosine/adenosine deaminase-related metal-dependent hydrolase